MKGSLARLALIALVVCTLSTAAFAQTTTGAISGTVTGPDGMPLPGVVIIANSPALIQRDQSAVTNAEGFFRFALLPPGAYELSLTIEGFRSLQRSGIVVRVGETTPVNSTLTMAAVTETEIVVGEAPNIDPRQAKLGFNVGADLAQNIPTARNMSDLLSTVPGVESLNNLGGGNQPGTIEVQNVLGTGERSSSYRYDGMNTTDPAGQWNTQANMAFDAIEEVQVLKAAKPAEVAFQGALFNVITKSGGNDFSGNIGGYFANDGLQASNTGDLEGSDSSNTLDRQYEITGTFGGKFVQDKAWWFVSGRVFNGRTDILSFPFAPVNEKARSLSAKATWQLNQNHRLTATGTLWDQEVSHYFFGYSPALALDENASAFRPLDGQTVGVQWSGILSDNVIAEANINYSTDDFDQLLQPGGRRAIVDLVTGTRQFSGSGANPGQIRDQDNDFWNVRGDLSWYVPDAAGEHDVKFGVEYMPTRTQILFDEPEGHLLNTVFGSQRIVRLLNTPTTSIWDNDALSLYAQDAWSVGDRLTLNVGLRYMYTTASTPEQPTGGGPWADTPLVNRFPEMAAAIQQPLDLVTWNTVEPRLAATYALGDRGRTILRGGASRYYQNLNSFTFFVSSPAFPTTWGLLWFDRNDNFEYEVGEEGPLLFSFGGSLNTVDPNLKRPYTDELIFGVSHEFARDLQISANGILRRDRNLVASQGVGDVSFTPVDVLDPGPDGIAGTGDDATITVFNQDADTLGNNRLLVTNPPGANRDYKGLEVTASKRFTNNWQAVGSLVWSEQKVALSTLALGQLGVYDSPNGLINAEGLDEANQTVQVKLQGTYRFDFGLAVSGLYRYRTGNPYTRELVVNGLNQGTFNVRAEARGASTTDNVSTIDLRLEQGFDLSTGRVSLILDTFNLFNSSSSTDEGFITSVNYGDVQSILEPRLIRLGARYVW